MRKVSVFSYPIVIKEQLGAIVISAPDFSIYEVIQMPSSGGLSSKFAAQIAFGYIKVLRKVMAESKAKADAKIPLPKPSETKDLFDFKMDEKSYSPAEISKMLGVSKNTIRRAIDKGLVECPKTPGGHRLIGEAQFLKFKELFRTVD